MPATIYGLSLTERLGPNSVGRKVLLHVTQLTLTPGHPYFLPSGCGSRHSHLPPPTSRCANPRYITVRGNNVPASPPTPTHTDCHCMPRCFPPTVHGNAAKPIWRKNGGQAGSVHHSAHRTRPGLGSSAPVLQCCRFLSSSLLLCAPLTGNTLLFFPAPL